MAAAADPFFLEALRLLVDEAEADVLVAAVADPFVLETLWLPVDEAEADEFTRALSGAAPFCVVAG